MGSSRLPGKVLLDIEGQPMLARVVERTRCAATVHQIVVATTTEVDDDPVAEFLPGARLQLPARQPPRCARPLLPGSARRSRPR